MSQSEGVGSGCTLPSRHLSLFPTGIGENSSESDRAQRHLPQAFLSRAASGALETLAASALPLACALGSSRSTRRLPARAHKPPGMATIPGASVASRCRADHKGIFGGFFHFQSRNANGKTVKTAPSSPTPAVI